MGQADYIKFFKGSIPQNSLGPFLNTLSQMLSSFSPTSSNESGVACEIP